MSPISAGSFGWDKVCQTGTKGSLSGSIAWDGTTRLLTRRYRTVVRKLVCPSSRWTTGRKHVDWLKRWLTSTSGREPPQSGLGKACRCWPNHWDALTRFLDDGRLEIDNTEVERQIRALALGRKTYLFAGSHVGAERAAVLYSLMRSCDLAEVDATDWLEDVLVTIAGGWPQSRIDELLPHRWLPA